MGLENIQETLTIFSKSPIKKLLGQLHDDNNFDENMEILGLLNHSQLQ